MGTGRKMLKVPIFSKLAEFHRGIVRTISYSISVDVDNSRDQQGPGNVGLHTQSSH